MAVSAWKVMIALAIGLIVFAVYTSVFDTSLGPGGTAISFVLAMVFSLVLYVTMRFGFNIGKRIGHDED